MKTISRSFMAAALLFSGQFVCAQDMSAGARRNAWYLELLGNGGLYSINYERRVRPQVVMRYGAAAWTAEDLFSDAETRIYSFPFTASRLFGSSKHKFELGGGIMGGHQKNEFDDKGFFLNVTGIAGYRYEADSGFLFRAGLTPFYPLSGGEDAYPDDDAMGSVGISFGFRH